MGKTILIIDDDTECTKHVQPRLERAGYVVKAAATGPDGLALAKAVKPDLIILDLLIQGHIEGFDVSRELAAMPELKGKAILLLTGVRKAFHLPFSIEPDPKRLPVTQVLEKPLQNGRLLKAVTDLIGAA